MWLVIMESGCEGLPCEALFPSLLWLSHSQADTGEEVGLTGHFLFSKGMAPTSTCWFILLAHLLKALLGLNFELSVRT